MATPKQITRLALSKIPITAKPGQVRPKLVDLGSGIYLSFACCVCFLSFDRLGLYCQGDGRVVIEAAKLGYQATGIEVNGDSSTF
jgi:hypothetical protein